MPESPALTIAELDVEAYRAAIPELAALIVDAVATGAGVNFLEGVTWTKPPRGGGLARQMWRPAGRRRSWPSTDGRMVGSTLLIRSVNQNSPHRAEIGKVIVLGRTGVAGWRRR